MTVRDNMGFALKLAGAPKDEIDRKVNEAARILDLEQHLERKPANLSGGQRQRVAMGRAIVRDPSAFLMDEPLSNLDAKLRVQMRAEVSRIQNRLGTTTVYVTHDQTEAMTLGDRVAVMRAGILQQVDSPKELYEHPVNLFVAGFIGSPAMNFFPGSVDGDNVRFPLGTFPLPESLRGSTPANILVGARPEHFEDAKIIGDKPGLTFETDISLVESLGSDLFAYFDYEGEGVVAEELAELAADSGAADVPSSGEANQAVARLEPSSDIQAGGRARLWLDTSKIHLFDPSTGESLTVQKRTPAAAATA
jgi:multiple sugar transport system ATP-binding protein